MSAVEYSPLKPSWEKVVKRPQTTEIWLKNYGLRANKLTWSQIASKLGFKKKSSHVTALHQSVNSRYGNGLFTQYSTSPDQIYQLTADLKKIEAIEQQVLALLAKLKARLKWLQSGSRLKFGVILEKRPVLVVVSDGKHTDILSAVVASVVQEQCVDCHSFNLVTCYNDPALWRDKMADPTMDNIHSAVEWLTEWSKTVSPASRRVPSSATTDALTLSLTLQDADCVYLVVYDDACLKGYSELVAMARKFPTPVNVVAVNCRVPSTLDKMKQIASLTDGRCHCYQMNNDGGPSLTREDVVLLEQEVDTAKTVLAEIQALKMDVRETDGPDNSVQGRIPLEVKPEEFMTSVEWLTKYGIHAQKLTFRHLVGSLAFRHCDGVLKQPSTHSLGSEVSLVSSYEVVHAKYCSAFVHLRWRDGAVVHVNLTKPLADDFQQRIEGVMESYQQRISWLHQGSRELFGTLLEECVVLILDTSSSMKLHLPLVKDKFCQLVQEQLCHKRQFTVVQCTSSVRWWRKKLVAVNTQSLEQVFHWVDSLQAEGSSNILDVLQAATTVPEVQGVYLLTDGRPDQLPSTILAARHSWPAVPIHTISFNCADSTANHFLAQLSDDSGGRYHYFADDVEDTNGPVPYKSADVKALLNEIELAKHELVRVHQLEVECAHMGQKQSEEKRTESHSLPHDETADTVSEEGVEGSVVSMETDRKGKTLISSKRWLKKNSLSAKGLNLVDALGPSAVPHPPTKPLPHSGKPVYGKVLRDMLPVSHVTANGRVTLIHPSEPDLRSFKDRLTTQLDIYSRRLNCLVKDALPEEDYRMVHSGHDGSDSCSENERRYVDYFEKKQAIFSALTNLGWPRDKEDFQLLEKEWTEGRKTLDYLTALLLTSMETNALGGLDSVSSSQSECSLSESTASSLSMPTTSAEFSNKKLVRSSTRSKHPIPTGSKGPIPAESKGPIPTGGKAMLRKGTSVLAQDSRDGFFYQGRVATSNQRKRSVVVEFADGETQSVEMDLILEVGGARPCPLLKVSDVALVRVRSRHSTHWRSHDTPCDMYIPCAVLKAPPLPHLSTAYYSCSAYNGKKVMCTRRHMVAISNKQYELFKDEILLKQTYEHTPPASEGRDDVQHWSQQCNGVGGTQDWSQQSNGVGEKSLLKKQVKNAHRHNEERMSPFCSSPPFSPTPSSLPHPAPPTLSPLAPPTSPSPAPPTTMEVCVQATELCERASSPVHMVSSVAVNTTSFEEKSTSTGPLMADVCTTTEWVGGPDGTLEFSSDVVCDPSLSPRTPVLSIVGQQAAAEEGEKSTAYVKTEEVDQPVKELVDKATERTVDQTIGQMTNQTITQTADHTIGQTADQTIGQTGDQTRGQTKGQTTDQTIGQTADQTIGQTADQTANQTFDQQGEQTGAFEQTSHFSRFYPPRSSTPTRPFHSSISKVTVMSTPVLARWSTDGWYRKAIVVEDKQDGSFLVMDDLQEGDIVAKDNMVIISNEPTMVPIVTGSYIITHHPHYPACYGPAQVAAHMFGDQYAIITADGISGVATRADMFLINEDKYHRDSQCIVAKQQEWIGQGVVARQEDGFFYRGTIREYSDGHFLIMWLKNGSVESVPSTHVFGQAQKRRVIQCGDYVIAFKTAEAMLAAPGKVLGQEEGKFNVLFCDGKKYSDIPPHTCLWVSPKYYQDCLAYILDQSQDTDDYSDPETCTT